MLAGGGTISFVYSFSYCSQESDASAMLVRLPWCRRGGAGVSASSWISWLGADGEVAGVGGLCSQGFSGDYRCRGCIWGKIVSLLMIL